MSDATRIVLVKPGDILIFGNVGDLSDANGSVAHIDSALVAIKEALGLSRVVVFEADIDMAALPGDGPRA